MTTLKDVMVYLLRYYPHKDELSKARFTKMVYLADWRSAILQKRQITDIEWVFNDYGPYVRDLVNLADADPAFARIPTTGSYGQRKDLITLVDTAYRPTIEKDDEQILDHVIKQTSPKNYTDFIRLVYSTYPIRTQPRHVPLDLVSLARQYELERNAFATV